MYTCVCTDYSVATGNHNHTKFTSFEMNVSESVFALGGLLGALPAGLMADGLGR